MSALAVAPIKSQPRKQAVKRSYIPPVPAKGDIEACTKYARYLADKSDKPRHEVLAVVWVRFLNWSFLSDGKYQGATS